MGLGGIFKLGLLGALISIGALYYRYGNREKFDTQSYKLPDPPELVGPLEVNNWLQKASYILKNRIHGPESFVIDGDKIYATTHDASVIEITKGKITKTIRFTKEKDCGTYDSEPRCGRPLGIRRFGKTSEFLVADAYLGLFKVDFATGKFTRLVRGDAVVDGHRLRFLNDVEIVNDDEYLFTDSSFRWERRHFMHPMLEHAPTGRVLRYRVSTNELSTVLDNLYFANGLQLMPDGESFLVAELAEARIKRHYITGKKAGKTEVFASNLPAFPDNIRLSTNGTIWVGTSGIRHAGMTSLLDKLGPHPAIRQFVLDVVPGWFWSSYFHLLKPPHSLILQFDLNGKIISSLHDPDSSVITDVSQVSDDAEFLYLGSYHSPYIARVSKHHDFFPQK